MKYLLSLIFIFVCSVSAVGPVYAQRQSYLIPPKDTDPQIDTALEPHYVAVHKSAPRKNQLFLFFPGTNARPEQYLRLSETAADLGFHVINLRYQNDDAVYRLCGGTNTDLDCYEKMRMEIIDGTDRTPLVTITRTNSVENRVIKLLQYLQGRFPMTCGSSFSTVTARSSGRWLPPPGIRKAAGTQGSSPRNTA